MRMEIVRVRVGVRGGVGVRMGVRMGLKMRVERVTKMIWREKLKRMKKNRMKMTIRLLKIQKLILVV